MRILDLFCGAGGAAMGYHRAGFDVVGVDINPQPNYPFEFHKADVMRHLAQKPMSRDWIIDIDGLRLYLGQFDAIHASPPCQRYSSLNVMKNAREDHPDLVAPTREALIRTGLPYVIENVQGAPLDSPFKLCGSMFGLGVPELDRELRRHRLFETNWEVGLLPKCFHERRACGIYGDHFRLGRRSADGQFSGTRALAYGSEAMGVEWMKWDELKEAIPPAYTEFIGQRLLTHLTPSL